MGSLLENAPKIISEAAKSPLGLFALMVLALAVLGYFFFREAREQTRIAIFVVMFIGVASFGIAIFRATPPPAEMEKPAGEISEQQPPAQQPHLPAKPEAEMAEARPSELALLVNRNVARVPGKPNVAIVIVSGRTKGGLSPASLLYNLLREEEINLVVNLFNEKQFIAEGFFGEIYGGNTRLLKESKALAGVNYLILGELHYSTRKGAAADSDLISCDIMFSYKIINRNAEVIRSDSVRVTGPGFTEDAALERGVELLAERHSGRILEPVLSRR